MLLQEETCVYFLLLCACFFSEFFDTRTNPSSCGSFSQTLSLLLHSPPLEQLLEESWFGSIVHRLHICSDWVVFHFNELLQHQISRNTGNK